MSKLLFRLHNVPDDEANDIRELLDAGGIDYYETDDGRWRVGVAAIWIKDDSRFDHARGLIDAYQADRYRTVSAEKPPSLRQAVGDHPLRFLMALLAIALVLLLTVLPFWSSLHR